MLAIHADPRQQSTIYIGPNDQTEAYLARQASSRILRALMPLEAPKSRMMTFSASVPFVPALDERVGGGPSEDAAKRLPRASSLSDPLSSEDDPEVPATAGETLD